MKILYLVPDLDDPAVSRRLGFLQQDGASIALAGFHRREQGRPQLKGVQRVAIGRTRNGKMTQRAVSVLLALTTRRQWQTLAPGSTVIMARNLEMLILGALVRKLAGDSIPLVYECLDIHRLMTGRSLVSRVLRRIEVRLLRQCALLVVSSPAFVTAYFQKYHGSLPAVYLLENKLPHFELPGKATDRQARADGPPWRIGWFGMIRCRRSLTVLAALVTRLPGLIEVEIRGRPSRDVVPDFDRVVAETPGLYFGGSYDRARDLEAMYRLVHFTWAIDFYEAGANSSWLLPNRLYEGGVFGSVPLALDNVETGFWLQRHHCGALLREPLLDTLVDYFSSLDRQTFRVAECAVNDVCRSAFVETEAAASQFSQTLQTLPARAGARS